MELLGTGSEVPFIRSFVYAKDPKFTKKICFISITSICFSFTAVEKGICAVFEISQLSLHIVLVHARSIFLLSPRDAQMNVKTKQRECCRAAADVTTAQLTDGLDFLEHLASLFDMLVDILLVHMKYGGQ